MSQQFIGKGSYGCTVKPAFKNKDEKGNWHEYPDNITKLFFKESDQEKAYQSQTRIKELLKNEGLRINKYKFSDFQGVGLPPTIRTQCFGSKVPEKLYPVRLPNLGKDMLTYNEELISKYRRIPLKTILEQMNKVIQQTATLYKNGLIHGDLREPNIMINPETGRITMIDFDLLAEKDIFFQGYFPAFGFYNNPPECLLMDTLHILYNAFENVTMLQQFFNSYFLGEKMNKNSKLMKYMNTHNNMKHTDVYYANRDFTPQMLFNCFYYALEKLKKECRAVPGMALGVPQINALRKCFFDMVAPYFDGYGVAMTFLEFISYVYGRLVFFAYDATTKGQVIEMMRDTRMFDGDKKYSMEETEILFDSLRKFVFEVLMPMNDIYIGRRITIEEAAARSQKIVDELGVRLGEGLRGELERMSLLASYGLPVKGGRWRRRKTRRGGKRVKRNTRKH